MPESSATPMLPPEIRQQMEAQQQSESPSSMMMQAGQGQEGVAGGVQGKAEVLSALEQKIGNLEQLVGEINQMLQVVHPPSKAYLVPIAQSGKALQVSIRQVRQQMAGGGAQPQPQRPPNPAEGTPSRAAM